MTEHDWDSVLEGHPIFDISNGSGGPAGTPDTSLELSTSTLPHFLHVDSAQDGPEPCGRRRAMVLKDAELIVAVGKELRMTSLEESKLYRKSYKTLYTPRIEFEIHQIALNFTGKLLAVAGAFQVAVVVVPRPGYIQLIPSTLDCRSIQVGQFYHAARTSAPIAKIEWHPWGEAGSTLMVMTVDGKLREYDISVDTEEPQQTLSFVPEKKTSSFFAEDESEREVLSFTLGKGKADWGPLTIYALTRSGDVYSICPYMPQNACIPPSYVHALECFVSAKQDFLSQGTSSATAALSSLYDYQRKYINALVKQLQPGTVFAAASRSIPMHPPSTMRQPVRQGPFLLQPSPRILEGGEGGDATDIAYLAFSADSDDEIERMGVVMIAYKDGKVDVCLDVEKVEARWKTKQDSNHELPILAVYESIDLGLISLLKRSSSSSSDLSVLDLLQGNHPVFHLDPIYDDVVYVYHAFGAHALDFSSLLGSLTDALHKGDDEEIFLSDVLESAEGTQVTPLLGTFSIQRKCSNPVVAVTVPNNIYLTYSIFILTSAMQPMTLPLTLRNKFTIPDSPPHEPQEIDAPLTPIEGPSAYVSLLGTDPYTPPQVLTRSFGLPSSPRLSVGSPSSRTEFMLTPDTLRFLGTTVQDFTSQIHEVLLAYKAAEARMVLQKQEFSRQQEKCRDMMVLTAILGGRATSCQETFNRIQATQTTFSSRLDRTLQLFMQQASPELSDHETKWFEELRRMKQEITGVGRYDEASLTSRTSLLQREYDRVLPSLKDALSKENERKKNSAERSGLLGTSQAFELGSRSQAERTKVDDLEKELLELASRLAISVGQPPSLTNQEDDQEN